jgi:hypothetical protein
MKKGWLILGGSAAGFLFVFLAREFFFSKDAPRERVENDEGRRLAEWGIGS